MSPEEYAVKVFGAFDTRGWPSSWAAALRQKITDAIREAVAEERERCVCLEATVRPLLEDKARMDYMESTRNAEWFREFAGAPTLRAALDAARKQEEDL